MPKHSLPSPSKAQAQCLALALAFLPLVAHADWQSLITQYGSNIRLGMYAVAGTLSGGALLWTGIMWMLARATGDRSTSFMDYLQQVAVIALVGASFAIAAAAWSAFASSSSS